jgi:hypothetical protein
MTDTQKVIGEAKAAYPEANRPQSQSELNVYFVRGSLFRVVHASGVWYSGDSEQNLHLTFFNERSPIPEKLVLVLGPQGGVVGDVPEKRELKTGVVRELEVDVVLSQAAAEELYKTLGENLKLFRQGAK